MKNIEGDKPTIRATSLSKSFGRNRLFSDICLCMPIGFSAAITGPNGSGKSTLLLILAGLMKPDSGRVVLLKDGAEITGSGIIRSVGYTGPLIHPYRDLTGIENAMFCSRQGDKMAMMELMERFGLSSHIDKQTRHYSSGMLQRLRLVMCLANGPDIILLDEPGDNLDDDGRERLYSFLESVKPDKIIIIATNSSHEAGLCGTGVRLGL